MIDRFVIDATVALAWVLPSQASTTTALRLRSSTSSELALEMLGRLGVEVEEEGPRHALRTVSQLATMHGLSVYDAVYLELALRSGLPLGTGDRSLRTAARSAGVPLR